LGRVENPGLRRHISSLERKEMHDIPRSVCSEKSTRRAFLKKGIHFLIGTIGIGGLLTNAKRALSGVIRSPRQVFSLRRKRGGASPEVGTKYCTKLDKKMIQCRTCFRECIVEPNERGFCLSRINIEGRYYTLTYGRPSALQIDPVEKEPSYHFLPGMSILCTGTACCTNRCKFCHNWHLSQTDIYDIDYFELSPRDIVGVARSNKCEGMSFTYNEPTVFFEYMLEIMRIGKEEGLRLLFHTNGGLAEEPLSDLLEVTDAITVDLKGFTEAFYRDVSSSRLYPVLETLRRVRRTAVHLEVVNLVIPSLNDNMHDIRRMCVFIRDELGKTTPLHFTRFFPNYKLRNLPPTPVSTLEEARTIAAEEVGLHYVYIGNVPGHTYNSTFCPKCGRVIIDRRHFEVMSNKLENGSCPFCGMQIPGIWA